MKILFVSDVIPFPAANGKELPVNKHFSYLSKKHEIDFLLLHEKMSYFEENKVNIPPSFNEVHFVRRTQKNKKTAVIRELFGGKITSLQYTFDRMAILEALQSLQFDVVWFGTFNCFSLLEVIKKITPELYRKIGLSLQDVKTMSYRSAGVKYVKTGLKNVDHLQRFVRSFLMASWEREVLEHCDLIHVMTEAEKQKAMKLVGNGHVESQLMVLPNGIEEDLLARKYLGVDENKLLFMTHLDGPRKAESSWFLTKVWPHIRKQTDLVLWIVGAPPKNTMNPNDDRIKICGFVEDLGSVFEKVCMAILPIFHSCGYINRLHNALSVGVPLISTTYPASTCLELSNGKEILIENDAKNFAEAVIELYENKSKRIDMSMAAKRYASRQKTWTQLSEEFDNRLKETITR